MKTLHDIYRCPNCGHTAAHGNSFCRGCGIRFSSEDISRMKDDVRSVVGAPPWNLRDVYRCVHCSEHIAIEDKYCRGCGDYIDDQERQLMKMTLDEIARENWPSVIGCMIFVITVVALVSVAN
ncbi:MAG: zinc ribbon domain-containing protein [Pseudomonadota bacterium]|nr:zinc ribbon domain-containing protein [Pseudomonadota bacterium]